MDDDYYDDLSEYYDQSEFYGDEVDISVGDLLRQCVGPSISQTIAAIGPLLALCFVFRISCLLYTKNDKGQETGIPGSFVHVMSAVTGMVALHTFFKETLLYLLIFCSLAYVCMLLCHRLRQSWCGLVVSFLTVIYVITCELCVESTEWHKIRGAQMVLSMKVISLGFDSSSYSGFHPDSLLGVTQYLGYCFNVGTVIFGPWIKYHDYKQSIEQTENVYTWSWVKKVVTSSVLCIVCLCWSTCFLHWLIPDDTWRWFVAYRDAQSYRFSHYFISYSSEVTLTVCAIRISNTAHWDDSVSCPYQVEVPRSLVEVVTNWNLPMHNWLKNYVFKSARPLGTFTAILLTYGASSLLHGLNFQLAAVLFSLGFYSYVEHVFRRKLSTVFNACIEAKRCKNGCGHTYQAGSHLVMLANLMLGAMTVFHLAYLGLMFDNSDQQTQGYTMKHTLKKWDNLGFLSHWIILGTFVFYLFIK